MLRRLRAAPPGPFRAFAQSSTPAAVTDVSGNTVPVSAATIE